MYSIVKKAAAAASAIALVSSPVSAASLKEDARLTQGPPIHEAVSPYGDVLKCLSDQLTLEQKSVTYSVGQFADRTGKFNSVSDAGTGAFSSQGLEEMVITSLFKAGVSTSDFSLAWRAGTDWALGKMILGARPANGPNLQIIYPDVVINGAITSFDFMPGGGFSGNVAGIRLGHSRTRILVSMDARAVLMLGAKLPGGGGKVLAVDRPSKQIVGFEDSAGMARFFGHGDKATYVSLDFGHRPNEAIQMAERVMIDRTVANLLIQVNNVHACDELFAYADGVAGLEERKD